MRSILLSIAVFAFSSGWAQAQSAALPAEQLKIIKAATVFVKVRVGALGGSGSGFVVHATKDYGLIVTNQHVISPPADRLLGRVAPGSKVHIEAVFNSGHSASEWSTAAEVLFANKEADLALLKVRALRPIPEPLPLNGPDRLPETTPVYVCGFPFGENLAEGDKNPEISIGLASVSSNRTNDKGEVVTVQLNGALNPGNSGGPVVTQTGQLVGVAVRTLTGAGIGFAVPPAMVRQMVHDVHFTAPISTWLDGPPRTIRLESQIVDALKRLNRVSAHIVPAESIWKAPSTENLSAHPKAKSVPATVDAALSTVAISFPVPDSSHYWLQYSWLQPDGATRRSPTFLLVSDKARTEPVVPTPRGASVPQVVPGPRTNPNSGIPGLLGPDGKALPPIANSLGTTPAGQVDVDELNRTAGNRIGQRSSVDILTTGSCQGFGDGPSLMGFNRNRAMPGGLDFLVDAELAEKMSPKWFAGQAIAVRLTGTMRRPPHPKGWQLFVVDEIGLIGKDGTIVATYTRGGANAQPQPNSTDATAKLRAEEERLYSSFRTNPSQRIGQNHQYSMRIQEVKPETILVRGQPVNVMRVIANDRLDRPIADVRLYATEQFGGQLRNALKSQTNRGQNFEPQINFCPTRIGTDGILECGVYEFNYYDVNAKNSRVFVKAAAPDLSGPAAGTPDAGVQPNVPNTPQAVPPLPQPAAPAMVVPNPDEDVGVWIIPVVLIVGVGIVGGIVWAVRYQPAAKKSSRSTSRRREDDEDRPRSRSRR